MKTIQLPSANTATALGSFVTGAEEEKHRFRVLDGCGPEQEPLD